MRFIILKAKTQVKGPFTAESLSAFDVFSHQTPARLLRSTSNGEHLTDSALGFWSFLWFWVNANTTCGLWSSTHSRSNRQLGSEGVAVLFDITIMPEKKNETALIGGRCRALAVGEEWWRVESNVTEHARGRGNGNGNHSTSTKTSPLPAFFSPFCQSSSHKDPGTCWPQRYPAAGCTNRWCWRSRWPGRSSWAAAPAGAEPCRRRISGWPWGRWCSSTPGATPSPSATTSLALTLGSGGGERCRRWKKKERKQRIRKAKNCNHSWPP